MGITTFFLVYNTLIQSILNKKNIFTAASNVEKLFSYNEQEKL